MILFALLCFVIFIIGIILSVTNTVTRQTQEALTILPSTNGTTKEIGNYQDAGIPVSYLRRVKNRMIIPFSNNIYICVAIYF